MVEFLQGRFSPNKRSDFSIITSRYALRKGMYLNSAALDSFKRMADSAAKSGIQLLIVSGTRNYFAQKRIWEAKFLGRRKVHGTDLMKKYPNERKRALSILNWSSMPSTSRHHWGTDFDVGFDRKAISLTNRAYESGKGLKAYTWMVANAAKFGFCQPYKASPRSRRKGYRLGYQEEKWHWSYTPLSKTYLRKYSQALGQIKPQGFAGDQVGQSLFQNYVFNVDKDCL